MHNDRLFTEQDKPVASMPSHHNLNTIFTVLTDSSKRAFHEINARKVNNDKSPSQSMHDQAAGEIPPN